MLLDMQTGNPHQLIKLFLIAITPARHISIWYMYMQQRIVISVNSLKTITITHTK